MPRVLSLLPAIALALATLTSAQPLNDLTHLKTWPSGVRALINAPTAAAPAKTPNLLIVYATPNGNSAEWTLGGLLRTSPGSQALDWHYDIQHVLAQTRKFRDLDAADPKTARRIVLAVVQPDNKSWPAWRRAANEKSPSAADIAIKSIVQDLLNCAGPDATLILAGHSGGGSFITGYLNAHDPLPAQLQRIAYLDANYSYDDAQGHSRKLLAWLKSDPAARLISLAYDDREVTLEGKKIVSDTGGTFRATDRMAAGLGQRLSLSSSQSGLFSLRSDPADQVRLLVRQNPENLIWHTRLVEQNGLLYALTAGTPLEKQAGELGGWRNYSSYISAPLLQPGSKPLPEAPAPIHDLLAAWSNLPTPDREAKILAAAQSDSPSHLPAFLRPENFIPITVTATGPSGQSHTATFRVSADYFSLGTDSDFVRLPLIPATANAIAASLGCHLPTRKLVNDIYAAAPVQLEPRPLTKDRESLPTFLHHNLIIAGQLASTIQPTTKPTVPPLTAGHKKDLVLTPRLTEKPNSVAIYGWHRLNGQPIQPLYLGHTATYVDYSHGIRLIHGSVIVDGVPMQLSDVLANPELSPLISDEGPFTIPPLPSAVR
jgi:hypothetical protein